MRAVKLSAVILALLFGIPTAAQIQEKVDLDATYRIKDEGLNRSQVMDILSYLTDVYGGRLTGSPQIKAAAEWAKKKLMEWELVNVNLETWGPFGRGWSLKRFSAQVIEPQTIPLIGYPAAWSPGFDKPLMAEVVYFEGGTNDMEKCKGKLRSEEHTSELQSRQ